MHINGAKGFFAHHRILHHHHAGDPEKDDIKACDQDACGKVFSERFSVFGPAQSADGPQPRGEPRIQHIWIAG